MQIDRFHADMNDIDSRYLKDEIFEDDTNAGASDENSRSQLESQKGVLLHQSRRQRRSIETSDNNWVSASVSSTQETTDTDTGFLSELNCGLTQCTFISCLIGPLAKKEFTLFKVKSRLWVRTLNEIQRNDIEISSKLVSRVTKLPYGVNPSYLGYQTHVVTTQVGANLHSNTQHSLCNF